ncbi:MAG: hypothetical protein GC179_23425 [Anaerolineaceae bacterium]|nr:hypothetical protein [Anaerolineaceae bacterium]
MTISDLLWIAAGLFSVYWSMGRIVAGYRILRDQTYSYSTKSIFHERKFFQRKGKYTRSYGVGVFLCGIIALIILSSLLLNGTRDALSLIILPMLAGAMLFELPGQMLSERYFPKE